MDEEERALEHEALSAIFMDDLELDGEWHYKLRLAPEDCDVAHVSVCLEVTLDESYPSVSRPMLRIEQSTGLSKGHIQELLGVAEEMASASAGSVCVFEVATAVKQWLGEHNEPGLNDDSMYATYVRRQAEEKEAAERRDRETTETDDKLEAKQAERERQSRLYDGTPCTQETFEKWRIEFLAEIAAVTTSDDCKTLDSGKASAAKLTGKQLFLRGTAKEAAAQPEDEGESGLFLSLDDSLYQQDEADLEDIVFQDEDEDEAS